MSSSSSNQGNIAEDQTTMVTEDPNSNITEDQTNVVTEDPNSSITEDQTNVVTEDPNSSITEDQTNVVTEDPNSSITEDQTNVVTEDPNSNITEDQTNVVTEDPNSSITEDQTNVVTSDAERDSWDRGKHIGLYKAAANGNWEMAKELGVEREPLCTARITNFSETALHVAAAAGHSLFVNEILKLGMPAEALELKETKDGNTALHVVAIAGITEVAKIMLGINKKLPQIRNSAGWVPLLSAASHASSSNNQNEIVKYLYENTINDEPSPFSDQLGATLLCTLIKAGLYDTALSLVNDYKELAKQHHDEEKTCALQVIAEQPSAFLSGSRLSLGQRLIYPFIPVILDADLCDDSQHQAIKVNKDPAETTLRDLPSSSRSPATESLIVTYITQVPAIKQVYTEKLMHKQALALVKFIFEQISQMNNMAILGFFSKYDIWGAATRSGIVEIIDEGIQTFPFEINKHEILKIAIEQRNEKIFNLLCGKNMDKKLASFRDKFDNTILHFVAKLAPYPQLNSTAGAAFQMQQELRWFKAVEKITLNKDKLLKNKAGKTARVLFTEEHKELVEKGTKWMKDTAKSSMLVAALIATVVFGAAFTVPGGLINDSNSIKNGTPIFLHKSLFVVFMVSDAIALFSSTTSSIMFLSILTSRYTEEDFLYSLPRSMILNLATLFLSIFTMMIAFAAAQSLIVQHGAKWHMLPFAALVSVPVMSFALLLFPLFFQMVRSTFVAT